MALTLRCLSRRESHHPCQGSRLPVTISGASWGMKMAAPSSLAWKLKIQAPYSSESPQGKAVHHHSGLSYLCLLPVLTQPVTKLYYYYFFNLTHTTQFRVSKVYRLLQCTPCGRKGSFALVLLLAGPLLREWSLVVLRFGISGNP